MHIIARKYWFVTSEVRFQKKNNSVRMTRRLYVGSAGFRGYILPDIGRPIFSTEL